jgi:ankyrin repeat domain-containing protein 50
LNSLPLTLDASYERILLRIDPAQVSLARAALEFVFFSLCPPTLAELAEATAVGSYDGPFDIENRLFEPEDILRMCSSLLVLEYPDLDNLKMDNESDLEASVVDLSTSEIANPNPKPPTVKPAHYTVSEYMQSNRIRSSPVKFFAMSEDSGNVSLAKICLKYFLNFNNPEPLDVAIHKGYPLLTYARVFWHHHVTSALLQNDAVTTDFLRKFLDVKAYYVLNLVRLSHSISPYAIPPVNLVSTVFYLCAEGASCEVVKFAVDMGFDVNGEAEGAASALQLVASGHWGHDINKLNILLAAGAEVNFRGGPWGTALAAAVQSDSEERVARLLDVGADPNMRGYPSQSTALHFAVKPALYGSDTKSANNIVH